MFTRYWGCIEIKVCGFAHVWLLPNTWSCIIVLIVCKMFVVLQNLNTDLPKRFKCLIYDKINTIRAVLLLFQICAADVLIFEPLSWLCGTNRTLLSEQHKYHGEFTRHWGCIEIKVCGFAHVWLLPNIYLRPCIIVLIVMWSIWNNSYLNCGCRWKWRMIIAVNFPIYAIGKKKPEKKSGLQRDSNPWPPRCRHKVVKIHFFLFLISKGTDSKLLLLIISISCFSSSVWYV